MAAISSLQNNLLCVILSNSDLKQVSSVWCSLPFPRLLSLKVLEPLASNVIHDLHGGVIAAGLAYLIIRIVSSIEHDLIRAETITSCTQC